MPNGWGTHTRPIQNKPFPSLARFLKTGSTEHRAALGGAEWHGCLGAAPGTVGPRFRAHSAAAVAALGLAWLAAFGVVLEVLVVKKELFARRKDEFASAVNALQHSIRKFHGRFPIRRKIH
jgi:hypothetical protein